ALRRYAYLLKNIDSNAIVVSDLIDEYMYKYPRIEIDIEKSYIDRYVGVEIGKDRMIEILKSLGFGVYENNNIFHIDVPSYRATKDISIKADIVEEIARVYGYDNITASPILQPVRLTRLSKDVVRDYDIKYALADRFNMHEIHSYIWEDSMANKTLGIETKSYIRLVNSLQKDNDDIRATMTPTIIRALLQNKRYDNEVGIFEIGHIVTGMEDNLAVEEKSLGMGWLVEKDRLSAKLLETKNLIHYLFDYILTMPVKLVVAEPTENYLSPVNYYSVLSGDVCLGYVGVVHPSVQHKIDEDKYIIVAELNVTKINKLEPYHITFEQVSKFPVTTLDFNFVLGENEVYGKLENVANSIETNLTYKYQLLDIFINKENNTKSYTLRYFVTSMEHTLSSAEIEDFHKTVISTFENNGIYLKTE
ncbi:MAG: hypothetical protein ACI4PF_04645, partial [Christensenellales bacterium]